ncbi:MAG: imidazoleglycerol-phosphate dehydratase HisB [Lachnospiraceae bacterium]|nr:imidazoleglycerol-phosphate dehydratase HisB [Lachnospiraceae bacterium]
MREALITRKTNETQIELRLQVEGSGICQAQTGIGFLDHMLTAMTKQSRFNLSVQCQGDLEVDAHHSVEDIGIVFGQALAKALGDMRGIQRYGSAALPMDDAFLLVGLDLCGRSYLNYDIALNAQKVGNFDTELAKEFFLGFSRHAGATLHIKQLAGENTHHILECLFKTFGKALQQACAKDPLAKDEIPSTKGILI